MSDPMVIGLSNKNAQAKVLLFVKMFAHAGQLSLIPEDHGGNRSKLNPSIASTLSLGEKFYEKLTEKSELEEFVVNKEEFIQSVEATKSLILENEDLMKNCSVSNQRFDLFAKEVICEFIHKEISK